MGSGHTLWASAAVGPVLHWASLDPGTALARSPLLPSLTKPLFTKPLLKEPLLGEPFLRKPLIGEPLFRKPFLGEPLLKDPLLGKPLFIEPLLREPFLRDEAGEVGMDSCTELVGAAMLAVVEKLSGADPAGILLASPIELLPAPCTHRDDKLTLTSAFQYVGRHLTCS